MGFESRCGRARWCTLTARAGRMGGDSALLMAFDTDDATVYQVRSRHHYDEVSEIVPPNYVGVAAMWRIGGLCWEDGAVETRTDHRLRDRSLSDRDNWRLQNELGWQDDRGNLLRFLGDRGIEPTNNRAERVLRGAVIARKVSHCSRTEGGADALSAFTSVISTPTRTGAVQGCVLAHLVVNDAPLSPTPQIGLSEGHLQHTRWCKRGLNRYRPSCHPYHR